MYRGVPYAKSVNRFEYPEPVESWEFKDAKESGPACYQLMENLLQARVPQTFDTDTVEVSP